MTLRKKRDPVGSTTLNNHNKLETRSNRPEDAKPGRYMLHVRRRRNEVERRKEK